MNLQMGSQLFTNVEIPVLWGVRAILQDAKGLLSVINLGEEKAQIEVLADEQAPGISYRPTVDGFVILKGDLELYQYNPSEKILTGISLSLPECQVTPTEIRVGGMHMQGNTVMGYGVGIAVTERGVAIGAPLPVGLAKLIL